jgi:hypothetical protein
VSIPLEEVKEKIKAQYLGRGGIHGVGIRRGQNAVSVYVSPISDVEQERLLKEIEEAAAPYKLLVITEERPSLK